MFILLHRRKVVPIKQAINCIVCIREQHESAAQTKTTTESSGHYDIIISGSGLVGTTFAAALKKNSILADKKILLLEAGPVFKGFDSKALYSNRVSAVNNSSIALFKAIGGAWEHMQRARVKFVKQMQVWEANSDAVIQFQHEHFGSDVACIIENNLVLDAFHQQLKEADNIEIMNRARIKHVRLPMETGCRNVEIILKDGKKYTCDLIVGADGPNSIVRKHMNVNVFSFNYESMSLVATLELKQIDDNTVAWQRFLPTGPIALLPLDDKTCSLVWSTTIPHARELLAMSPTEFVNSINEAFCKQYTRFDMADKALQALNAFFGQAQQHIQYPPRVCSMYEKSRAIYPISLLHASSYVCNGAALIGDAAHRIHPLAGQGVNLGFSDVRFLVDALAAGAYAGATVSNKQYLLKYEQKALTKNAPIIAGVHALHTLYSTEFCPVVILRSLGLQLTQNLPVLKQLFMQRAIG